MKCYIGWPLCPNCGTKLEPLQDLYFHTGKAWFGCKECDQVTVQNHCSVSGMIRSIELCNLSYKEYMERINKKDE